jgi:uncharacterized membrane protein YgcG
MIRSAWPAWLSRKHERYRLNDGSLPAMYRTNGDVSHAVAYNRRHYLPLIFHFYRRFPNLNSFLICFQALNKVYCITAILPVSRVARFLNSFKRGVSMNIYVGNLSFDAVEGDVRSLFEAFGQVSSVSIIEDKFTGRPRGFAFVEMAQDTEAQAAIAALNGKDLKGRPLTVNEARPRSENRGGGGGGGGGFRGNRGGGGGHRAW